MCGLRAVAALLAMVALAPGIALADKNFERWLQELRTEARQQGISEATLDHALRDVEPMPIVIERDRKQPEFTLTFQEYLDLVVPPERIEKGRQNLAENRALVDDVAAQYGVQPQILVALWGVESDFGRITGDFPVIDALATLSFDGRRPARFRPELLAALRILDEGHVAADAMTGSWAGAMGQPQFMPTSFVRFAVDHDGDGRRDIWQTRSDVFGSAANYLAKSGWRAGESWGRFVLLPPNMDTSMQAQRLPDIDAQARPASYWSARDVTDADGTPLDPDMPDAALILPDGDDGAALLVHHNFGVLMRWNPSFYFASAVGMLSDRIAQD